MAVGLSTCGRLSSTGQGIGPTIETLVTGGGSVAVVMTDFGRSFVTWSIPYDPDDRRKPGHMPWGNSARILIDARCTIFDETDGRTEELYLIAPCRTEWMYRESGIIQEPNSEYRVIFSRDRQLFVGKSITEETERSPSTTTERFTSMEFSVPSIAATPLETDRAVVAATKRLVPIVGKTELVDEQSGLRATLEYPVKTMNFHEERQRFQVDTGPLIFPDLGSSEPWLIDRCRLAHTVYNTFDYAEFICKQPTSIERNGEAVASVFHYADVRRMAVRTTLFGLADGREEARCL